MPPTATLARPSTPVLTYKEFQGRVLERKDVAPDATEDYIREALVAVTGNTDDGGDVIQPGAFTFKRAPKVVWSHDLRTLVGKVLAYEELLPGDSRLVEMAPDLAAKGLGALWFRVQFDPLDPESFKAFRKVDFHEDLGWSIGYETPPDGFKVLKDGRRLLTKIIVWEGSPTTFGMNMEARTVALKSLIHSAVEDLGLSEEKAKAVQDLIATLAAPGPEEEKTWPPLAGSMEETQEALREAVRAWAAQVYGDVTSENDWWCSLEGTFETEVVASVRVYTGESESGTWRFPYVLDAADGSVELGEPTQVEIQTTVEVAPAPPPPAATTAPSTASADLGDLDAKTLGDALAEVKKGRVLSAANAAALQAAVDTIAKVLAAAAPKEDPPPKEKAVARSVVEPGEPARVEVKAVVPPETESVEGDEDADVDTLTEIEVLEMLAAAE